MHKTFYVYFGISSKIFDFAQTHITQNYSHICVSQKGRSTKYFLKIASFKKTQN